MQPPRPPMPPSARCRNGICAISTRRRIRRRCRPISRRRRRRPRPFSLRFQGKLAEIDGAALGQAVAKSYEALQDVLGRIMSYAQLVHAGNMTDPEIGRFYQTMQERVTDISTELLFFTLELNRLEDGGSRRRS